MNENKTESGLSSSSSHTDDNLENLLRQLHGQITNSDWLQINTATKLEHENPELIQAWKNAIENVDGINQNSSPQNSATSNTNDKNAN